MSVVGVPGSAAGSAFRNYGGDFRGTVGSMTGYLRLDPATERYDFVFSDYVPFSTQATGGQAGPEHDHRRPVRLHPEPAGRLDCGLPGPQPQRHPPCGRGEETGRGIPDQYREPGHQPRRAAAPGQRTEERWRARNICWSSCRASAIPADPSGPRPGPQIGAAVADLGGTAGVFNALDGGGYALVGRRRPVAAGCRGQPAALRAAGQTDRPAGPRARLAVPAAARRSGQPGQRRPHPARLPGPRSRSRRSRRRPSRQPRRTSAFRSSSARPPRPAATSGPSTTRPTGPTGRASRLTCRSRTCARTAPASPLPSARPCAASCTARYLT